MNKKNICTKNESFGYYSGFGGVEFKFIDYGINDYIYCVSGAWNGSKKYHRLKIHYGTECPYIILNGHRILLKDCIRMGAF